MRSEDHSPLERAAAALRDGRPREAVDLLRHWAAAHTADAQGQALLGAAYSQLGDNDAALRYLREATRLAPNGANHWFNLGVVSEKAGELHAAADAYSTCLRLNPAHSQAQTFLRHARQEIAASTLPPSEAVVEEPAAPVESPEVEVSKADDPAEALPADAEDKSGPPGSVRCPSCGEWVRPAPSCEFCAGILPPLDPIVPPSTSDQAPPGDSAEAEEASAGGEGLTSQNDHSATTEPEEPAGPPGMAKCPHCGQWSRIALTCEFCAGHLPPPNPPPTASSGATTAHGLPGDYTHTPAPGFDPTLLLAANMLGTGPAGRTGMDKPEAFMRRFGAHVADVFIMGAVGEVINIFYCWVLTPFTAAIPALVISEFFITVAAHLTVHCIYYGGMLSVLGATLGKRFLGLKVVDANGNYPRFWTAVLRETIGKWLSGIILMLGFLWMWQDDEQRTWHDHLAGTYVVRDPEAMTR